MKKWIALVVCLLMLLCGCRQPQNLPEVSGGSEVARGAELMCIAESEEEAQEIASLYGIQLVSYGSGVAVFTTGEDYRDVIKRGEENGWPLLEGNYIMQLY